MHVQVAWLRFQHRIATLIETDATLYPTVFTLQEEEDIPSGLFIPSTRLIAAIAKGGSC